MKKSLDSTEPELKGLIQRVMLHYKNQNKYLKENLEWLSEPYIRSKEYYNKKLDEGFSMAVAHKHVLDLGGNVVGKVVISNHSKMPGVITPDELR